jgi:hypothetical protein
VIHLLFLALATAVEPADEAPPNDEIVTGLLAREPELLQAVELNDPGHYQRLMALKNADRRSYLAALYKVSRVVERTRSDPAFAERMRQIQLREVELRTLAAGFAERPAAEQVAVRAQLVALAGQLMELKQSERRQRLEELRARLEALEREIEERERDRERIVGDYVDRLVR